MEQSRKGSLIEACINTGIGFVISLLLAFAVYPLFGHTFTASQNLGITVIYTVVSVARSYAVRRWANARIKALSVRLAVKAQSGGLS